MNAVAKVFTHKTFVNNGVAAVRFPLPKLRMFILFIAVLVTAISLIYVEDLDRRLFIDLQNLQQMNTDLQVEHGKLLLESSAWSSQARVQKIAELRLNMEIPSLENIVLVKL